MSEEYIERETAIGMAISGKIRTLPTTEDGEDWIRVEEVRESLQSIPSADVAPVRHGKWIIKDKHINQCNRCGNYLDIRGLNGGRGDANYCPNCGARMDGGKNV